MFPYLDMMIYKTHSHRKVIVNDIGFLTSEKQHTCGEKAHGAQHQYNNTYFMTYRIVVRAAAIQETNQAFFHP